MNSANLTTLSLVLSSLALIVGVYAIIAAGRVKNWRKLFSDTNERPDNLPDNLEDIIARIASKIKILENRQLQSKEHAVQLQQLLGFAIQQVGLIRFNSQADEGGNLSFSLALLDAQRSGFVITSLHGRQQNRIYAKQIITGISEVNLSEEEQNAVFAAIKGANKNPLPPLKPAKPKAKRTTK